MTFIKTSLLSGAATILSMVLGFILNKVLAVYIGPAGFGLLGQFQNFLSVLQLWATGGVAIGVVKYTAEFRDDPEQKHAFWSMGIRISLIFTSVCSVVIFIFSNQLSLWILKSIEFVFVFKMMAFVVFFFVWNQFLLSVLNGQKEIKRLLLINIISSMIKLGLVWWFSVLYGIEGALLGLVIMQLLIFCVSLYLVIHLEWFSWSYFFCAYDAAKVKLLLGFTLMAVVGGITAPVSQFLVRDFVGENLSWNMAGQLQALWNISNAYIAVLSTVLTIYFLPKLSEIQDVRLLREEVFSALRIVVPVLILLSCVVVFFRREIILIMYTDEFLLLSDLFYFQLFGDFIKGVSFLFSFIMLAKSMTGAFVSTQVIFSLSFVILSQFLASKYGLIGVSGAYAINYTLYLVTTVCIFIKVTRINRV